MDAVIENHDTAPVPDRWTALFSLVEAIAETGWTACEGGEQADVDRALCPPGGLWSQDSVYDFLTVCALFNYCNSWVDAAGVEGMTDEQYAASGRRLASEVYLPGTD